MNIGFQIKKLRRDIPMSQGELAEKVGVSQPHLSLMENGQRNTETALLKKIAECLNVPLPVLLWLSVEESDIAPEKMETYKVIKPIIEDLIKQI